MISAKTARATANAVAKVNHEKAAQPGLAIIEAISEKVKYASKCGLTSATWNPAPLTFPSTRDFVRESLEKAGYRVAVTDAGIYRITWDEA